MDSLNETLTSLLSTTSPTLGQMLLAIAVAYAGGLASSLTPCIYPMIPITIGVIGTGAERRWRTIALRAVSYIAGMSLTYSFLGVAAALTGKLFGSLTQSAGWYIGIGLFLALAALAMLDVIPAWTPFKNHSANARGHRRSRTGGAFVVGLGSGFIAAPCTTPVLAGVLGFIATTRSVLLGFALMLAFSFGLGTLLLAVAAFTGSLRVLPKSGRWMKAVKMASGAILLTFAAYLVYLGSLRL